MEYLEKLLSSWFSQSSVIPGSTRRVLRRMWPRRGLAVPRSSSVPSLELLCRQETSLFLSHPNAVFAFPISALFNNLWSGYHGEEEPEARGAKSPEGAGSPRRQGSEESHRQEARCQGEKLLNLWCIGGVSFHPFCWCTPVFHWQKMFTLTIQDKAAQKAQKATKNVQKAGPGRVGGKR